MRTRYPSRALVWAGQPRRPRILDLLVFLLIAAPGPAQDCEAVRDLGVHYPSRAVLNEDWLAYDRDEWEDWVGDLNGDADTDDSMIVLENLATGSTSIVPLPASGHVLHVSGGWMTSGVWTDFSRPSWSGSCLTLHVYEIATGETRDLDSCVLDDGLIGRYGDYLVFAVPEDVRGEDLNGDGDAADSVLHVHSLSNGETRNLRLAYWRGARPVLSGDRLLLRILEDHQGEDLNGDGDATDLGLLVYHLEPGETTNLGLAVGWNPRYSLFSVSGNRIVFERDGGVHLYDLSTGAFTDLGLRSIGFSVSGDLVAINVFEHGVHVYDLATGQMTALGVASVGSATFDGGLVFSVVESVQGEDLNGDGDTEDRVLHVHDHATGETVNLGLAGTPFAPRFTRDWLVLGASESEEGGDLNGDGDTEDSVVHLYDRTTGKTTNLGLTGWILPDVVGDRLVLSVREQTQGRDLNGDGDEKDLVVHVHEKTSGRTINLGIDVSNGDDGTESWPLIRGDDLSYYLVDPTRLGEDCNAFRRGEANADGELNISDGAFMLSWLFLGDDRPPCLDAADVDDSGAVDLSDAVALFSYLFTGGAAPPPPGPMECGTDATPDSLSCATSPESCD